MKPWAEAFYNSNTWRQTSRDYIASVGGVCERCSKPEDPIAAKIAHHKIYLTPQNINDPAVALAWENLEALCQDCHNKEHHRAPRVERYRFAADGSLLPPSPPVEKNIRGGRNTERGV